MGKKKKKKKKKDHEANPNKPTWSVPVASNACIWNLADPEAPNSRVDVCVSSVYLSITCPSICLCIQISDYPSVHLYVYISAFFTYLHVYMSTYPSTYMSVHLYGYIHVYICVGTVSCGIGLGLMMLDLQPLRTVDIAEGDDQSQPSLTSTYTY
jgi:hypothetical protein